ncbi:MAG: cation:proton antiporter [candidate division WOR-3 bacterium]
MENIFIIASIWLCLAVISAIIAYHLKISIALVEICVGILAAFFSNKFLGSELVGNDQEWLKFLASTGSIFLTFLAGAELDPKVIKVKLKEVFIVGFIGFFAPFIGASLISYFLLRWDVKASLLAGIALSTTSMAVVYSVMLETGLNKTEFGKGILGSCFINDLGTVIALGLIFSPFTLKTLIFVVFTIIVIILFPIFTQYITKIYGNRTAAIRIKWVSFVLFAMSAFALWAGSEAVLPAYILGMALAEFATKNSIWVRRLRSLTVGFLTPFYFIRAGSLVGISSLISAPIVFFVLFMSKVISKIFGLFPVVSVFRKDSKERWYYTLLMSTGLTFGTISALFGYSHNIINKQQYSLLVITVIASAVVPTMIANFYFLPKHLMKKEKENVNVYAKLEEMNEE